MGRLPRALIQYKTAYLNRSSAVQILTQIQPEVARLTHFIRSPLWIFPPIEGDQRTYTPQEIETFTSDPRYLLSLRKRNEATANSMFSENVHASMCTLLIRPRSLFAKLRPPKSSQDVSDIEYERRRGIRISGGEIDPTLQRRLPKNYTGPWILESTTKVKCTRVQGVLAEI